MTKTEQLKAKVYAIEAIEEKIEILETESKKTREEIDISQWDKEAIKEMEEKIKMLEYIIEELAK